MSIWRYWVKPWEQHFRAEDAVVCERDGMCAAVAFVALTGSDSDQVTESIRRYARYFAAATSMYNAVLEAIAIGARSERPPARTLEKWRNALREARGEYPAPDLADVPTPWPDDEASAQEEARLRAEVQAARTRLEDAEKDLAAFFQLKGIEES